MISQFCHRLPLLALLLAVVMGLGPAFAGTNVVKSSGMADIILPITANDLKPAQCAALNLTTIVVGSGTINGGGISSLIIGSPGNDIIRGKQGNDCLIGGGGNDTIDGDKGTDVCIGGPGMNIFLQCEAVYDP